MVLARMMCLGGYQFAGYTDLVEFDAIFNRWLTPNFANTMPFGLMGHQMVLVDGVLYVLGGVKIASRNFYDYALASTPYQRPMCRSGWAAPDGNDMCFPCSTGWAAFAGILPCSTLPYHPGALPLPLSLPCNPWVCLKVPRQSRVSHGKPNRTSNPHSPNTTTIKSHLSAPILDEAPMQCWVEQRSDIWFWRRHRCQLCLINPHKYHNSYTTPTPSRHKPNRKPTHRRWARFFSYACLQSSRKFVARPPRHVGSPSLSQPHVGLGWRALEVCRH